MERAIVFFDDMCVLCSRSVQFIYRHDHRKYFYFSSLDSEAYRQVKEHMKEQAPLNTMLPDSVILYMNGKLYLRSSAALRIAMRLRFPLPLLAVGFIIPPFLRDRLYDWIARNRYRWFGKRETCFVPEGNLRGRVLD